MLGIGGVILEDSTLRWRRSIMCLDDDLGIGELVGVCVCETSSCTEAWRHYQLLIIYIYIYFAGGSSSLVLLGPTKLRIRSEASNGHGCVPAI